mmetsp:Transcript_90359/g.160982  ORF Transcript_90359/g.160982 Transcript_90359/m.160982 type:complete len:225 (-) Transcript_90359:101-775(-)
MAPSELRKGCQSLSVFSWLPPGASFRSSGRGTVSNSHLGRLGHWLANLLHQALEPRSVHVKVLAALDAAELDGSQPIASLLVLTHDTTLAMERTVYRQHAALTDEGTIRLICGGCSREIPALLHERLLRTDGSGELVSEVFANVHGIQLDVAESVPWDVHTFGFHFLDDLMHTCTLGDEDVHTVILVHDGLQTSCFSHHVNGHLGQVDRMDAQAHVVHEEFRKQ